MNSVTSTHGSADIFALIELAIAEAGSDRAAARTERDGAFDHEISEKQQAIEEERQAAADSFAAGIAGACGAITSSATALAGDFASVGAPTKEEIGAAGAKVVDAEAKLNDSFNRSSLAEIENRMDTAVKAEEERDALQSRAKLGEKITNFGKATAAGLELGKASGEYLANQHKASAKEHEKEATIAEKGVADAKDDMDEARRVQHSYIDMVKQIAQKQDETRLAIVRG
jgi:hypothetical protein